MNTHEIQKYSHYLKNVLGIQQILITPQYQKMIEDSCKIQKKKVVFLFLKHHSVQNQQEEQMIKNTQDLFKKMRSAMGLDIEKESDHDIIECEAHKLQALKEYLLQNKKMDNHYLSAISFDPFFEPLLSNLSIPSIMTYSPYSMIMDPSKKRGVWEDLKKIMKHFQ